MEKRVDELSRTFNKGLLENQTETSDASSDEEEDTTDVHNQFSIASLPDSSTYFTSHEWQTKLSDIINAYQPVKQPAHRPSHNTQTSAAPAASDNVSRLLPFKHSNFQL